MTVMAIVAHNSGCYLNVGVGRCGQMRYETPQRNIDMAEIRTAVLLDANAGTQLTPGRAIYLVPGINYTWYW